MKQKNSHFNRVVLSGNSDWCRKSDRIRRKIKNKTTIPFTQPFQNKTISLTGTSVRSTMYFTKKLIIGT